MRFLRNDLTGDHFVESIPHTLGALDSGTGEIETITQLPEIDRSFHVVVQPFQ